MKNRTFVDETYIISVPAKHFTETFEFIVDFFCVKPLKFTYIYSNTSNKEISAFEYDILELNNKFIPVPVLAAILKLNLSAQENADCRYDPVERISILAKELRDYGYTFNMSTAISKKKFLKKI